MCQWKLTKAEVEVPDTGGQHEFLADSDDEGGVEAPDTFIEDSNDDENPLSSSTKEKKHRKKNENPKKMKKLKPVVDNLKQARDDGKFITSEMNRLFLSDSKFKDLFVFEAATGSVKFGDSSESRADTMVEIDTDSGKITSQYKMNSPSDISSLASQYKFYLSFKTSGNSTPSMELVRDFSGTATMIRFTNIGGSPYVGSITSTTSATAYNTSSDERLKDNIVDAPTASEDIDAIQVRSFDWKVDGEHQKYGMVAQELLEVAPDAVKQGDTPDDMMGVDYSKLVPMLIKEIQSLRQRVAQLEE